MTSSDQPHSVPETQKHLRSARYDIVVINTFLGLDPEATEQAKQSLIRTLKATPEQIMHLFENETTVIKRGVDSEKARRYAEALRGAGLECRLEYVRPAETSLANDFSATRTQPTPKAIQLDARDRQYRMGVIQVVVGLLLLAGLLVLSLPQFGSVLHRTSADSATATATATAVDTSATSATATSSATSSSTVAPATSPSAAVPAVSPASLPSNSLQHIAATDGKASLLVPTHWEKALKMHPDAYVQTGDHKRQLYILVMRESKDDAKKITLAKYMEAVAEQMVDGQAGAVVKPVDHVEPIDSMPALGFELRLTRNNMDMVYLVSVTEDKDWLYQFISLTPAARYHDNQLAMVTAIHSYSKQP